MWSQPWSVVLFWQYGGVPRSAHRLMTSRIFRILKILWVFTKRWRVHRQKGYHLNHPLGKKKIQPGNFQPVREAVEHIRKWEGHLQPQSRVYVWIWPMLETDEVSKLMPTYFQIHFPQKIILEISSGLQKTEKTTGLFCTQKLCEILLFYFKLISIHTPFLSLGY